MASEGSFETPSSARIFLSAGRPVLTLSTPEQLSLLEGGLVSEHCNGTGCSRVARFSLFWPPVQVNRSSAKRWKFLLVVRFGF